MGLMKAKPVTDAADAVDRAITEGLLDSKIFSTFQLAMMRRD
tara:strand:+ start:58 stop:183 length:126 start_codon:yes stop_codon:yes gene_type:complete